MPENNQGFGKYFEKYEGTLKEHGVILPFDLKASFMPMLVAMTQTLRKRMIELSCPLAPVEALMGTVDRMAARWTDASLSSINCSSSQEQVKKANDQVEDTLDAFGINATAHYAAACDFLALTVTDELLAENNLLEIEVSAEHFVSLIQRKNSVAAQSFHAMTLMIGKVMTGIAQETEDES